MSHVCNNSQSVFVVATGSDGWTFFVVFLPLDGELLQQHLAFWSQLNNWTTVRDSHQSATTDWAHHVGSSALSFLLFFATQRQIDGTKADWRWLVNRLCTQLMALWPIDVEWCRFGNRDYILNEHWTWRIATNWLHWCHMTEFASLNLVRVRNPYIRILEYDSEVWNQSEILETSHGETWYSHGYQLLSESLLKCLVN